MLNKDIVCTEESCTVQDLKYVYKRWTHKQWENKPVQQILALHGWLDNANSFDVLAPLLVSQCAVEIIALDMAGHGLSEHRHVQSHYNIWDDLLELDALIKKLELKDVVLMGHSRGGMVCTLLANCLKENLNKVIFIDGLLPMPIDSKLAPVQLAKYFKQRTREQKRVMPSYADANEAIEARCKAAGMTPETARPIVERGLVQTDNGRVQWRSDSRLTHASAIKFNKEQNTAFYQGINVPSLLLLASNGYKDFVIESFELSLEDNAWVDVRQITGSHHLHLEKEASQEIATLIKGFLKV